MLKIVEKRMPNPQGPGEVIAYALVAGQDIKAGDQIPGLIGYHKHMGPPIGEHYVLQLASNMVAIESGKTALIGTGFLNGRG